MSKLKVVGLIAGLIIGIAISLVAPPEGLTVKAMWGMGIIACAVTWLIFDAMPDYVVIIAMSSAWAGFKVVSFPQAFSTFADSAWWLMVGALGIGVAVDKSGLLKRLSLYIMNLFPATFTGQVLALTSAGVVIAPLIPSTTAKAAMIAPISMGISDAMDYPRKSQGAGGLFAAFYTGFVSTGPLFLSASFICYVVVKLMPQPYQSQLDWMTWLIAAWPWGVVMLLLTTLGTLKLYRPADEKKLPPGYAKAKLQELGAWSRNEKITMVTVIFALLFWMTETLHGINSAVVAMLAVCVLLYCNVYDRSLFRAGIGWDNAIFIAGIINIGTVMILLKVDKWLGKIVGPLVLPLMSNLYLFIPMLAVVIYLTRFVIVSWVTTITIFTVFLVPFAITAGIHPWIIGMTAFVSINIFVVFYQSSPFLTSFYATGGEMVTHRQMIKLSLLYCLANIVALVVSIPYWRMIGYIR